MSTTFQVYFGPRVFGTPLKVRKIEPRDCFAALAEGFDDVQAMPTYPAFLGLFYALAGVALVSMSSFANALHLAFPLAAGFALVGPFFAVGLYEMSRRRELGLTATWRDAFGALRSPALPSILALCAPSSQRGPRPVGAAEVQAVQAPGTCIGALAGMHRAAGPQSVCPVAARRATGGWRVGAG